MRDTTAHLVRPDPSSAGGERGTTPGRIVISGLTKRYGQVCAVDNLSFTVEPGRVTGFLGPNGAGKTTTLRMLLSLVTPTSGSATIGGVDYEDLCEPMRIVGAVLEASGAYKGRTGRNTLRVLAAAAGLADSRVDEVMELTGLSAAARRKVEGYSLGMRQRLGIRGRDARRSAGAHPRGAGQRPGP